MRAKLVQETIKHLPPRDYKEIEKNKGTIEERAKLIKDAISILAEIYNVKVKEGEPDPEYYYAGFDHNGNFYSLGLDPSNVAPYEVQYEDGEQPITTSREVYSIEKGIDLLISWIEYSEYDRDVDDMVDESIKHLKPKSKEELTVIEKEQLGNDYKNYLKAKKLMEAAYKYCLSLKTYTPDAINLSTNDDDSDYYYSSVVQKNLDIEYGFNMRSEVELTDHPGGYSFYYFYWNNIENVHTLIYQDNGCSVEIKSLKDFKKHINDKDNVGEDSFEMLPKRIGS